VRDAEPLGELGAAAVVAVQELEHARRRAEPRDTLERLVDRDRVDQPHAAVDHESVRGAGERLLDDPGEAEVVLVVGGGPHAAKEPSPDRPIIRG
jgi:hypothetical protein